MNVATRVGIRANEYHMISVFRLPRHIGSPITVQTMLDSEAMNEAMYGDPWRLDVVNA